MADSLVREVLRLGAPRPLLSRSAEEKLGPRHSEVLDRLEHLFLAEGFSQLTIGGLAAGVGCSRRTLYELAPSKEQLVLVVLDRLLHRKGRTAFAAIEHDQPLIDQLHQYVTGGIDFEFRAAVYDDLADDPAARRLLDRHYRFGRTVIERLVTVGIERREFRPVNPAVVAATIAGSGLYLNQPDIIDDIGLDRSQILDEMLDFVLPSLLN